MMPGTEQRQKKVALSVRVSDRDRDAIAAKAASSGLPIAEYVRRCALGRQTPSRVDARLINELRRLGGLQKHLYNGDRDRGRQYAEILLDLTDAIRRVGQSVDAV
ncbi:MAG: mobilization protein [Candidatus Eremiobacteraeota bacterium]|nr:mobilization protein [Candidatus Eremiobacteraeota bacterium]